MPLGATIDTPMTRIDNVVTLLVHARDDDGLEGWGEIWCSFPRFGLHHRARLLREVMKPLAVDLAFASPRHLWRTLTEQTRVLRVQSGEPGPVAAVIAGIDIAAWDIVAKRAAQPLWRLLGGAAGDVRVYASLARNRAGPEHIEACLNVGMRAIKLRSMGGIENHLAVVQPVRNRFGDAFELMLDLNASWACDAAIADIARLGDARLAWLEEPIPADSAQRVWQRLAERAPMPLAGGENFISPQAFDDALSRSVLGVVQPDITKWGGFSAGLALARSIVASGRRFCPHMFAGAPGVLASAHLLAASGAADGLLEWPLGHNPARDAMLTRSLVDGSLALGDAPGLGLEFDAAAIDRYRVPS
jgi:L-alanine-DL-glutamate epimerase-like enolase superfamily enzyme